MTRKLTLGESERVDVVVIGAGPIGTLYASMLRLRRPGTRVLVLDRATEAGHKVGESTLSGFCKALRSVGVPRATMERLFYPKNGLGFLHVDETVRRLESASEYVLESFDETYQVERRVLDTLLQVQAGRLGVDIRAGASVDFEATRLGPHGNTVVYKQAGRQASVACRLVVDASGPAGLLSRHLGLRRTDGAPFQTSAVWTYYRNVRPLASYHWPAQAQFPRDQYTQHVCFREGWLWYIPLVSWEGAPTANLTRALSRALDPAPPDRDTLARESGAPWQPIVSVGLTLRSDRDDGAALDPSGTFDRYIRRYPAVAQLLAGAERLPDYYGRGRTMHARAAFRAYSERAAGDGWLLVGDAAFFVDPLISPGLTGGVAGAFEAVDATVRALDTGRSDAAAFASYHAFIRRLHAALERDNQLVYMSFNHPRALTLVQRFQEAQARRHFLDHGERPYEHADTNVWGILDADYEAAQVEAWEVMTSAERDGNYERMVRRLETRLAPHLDERLTPYVQTNAALATAVERGTTC
jgi:flavin-dependent dehydrogenase